MKKRTHLDQWDAVQEYFEGSRLVVVLRTWKLKRTVMDMLGVSVVDINVDLSDGEVNVVPGLSCGKNHWVIPGVGFVSLYCTSKQAYSAKVAGQRQSQPTGRQFEFRGGKELGANDVWVLSHLNPLDF